MKTKTSKKMDNLTKAVNDLTTTVETIKKLGYSTEILELNDLTSIYEDFKRAIEYNLKYREERTKIPTDENE